MFPKKLKKKSDFTLISNGIPAAREWAANKYKNFEFKRETVRDWQNKYRSTYVNNSTPSDTLSFKGPGRPSMLSDELTAEIKMILQNIRTSGCAVNRKVTISMGKGVLQAKCPDMLRDNGGKGRSRCPTSGHGVSSTP